jgi:hypothetical protein
MSKPSITHFQMKITEQRILHAAERNYTGLHVFAAPPFAAGPGSLCGVPFLSLEKSHFIVNPDSAVNCPKCLELLKDCDS